jgi:hypothetical protein
MIKIRKRDKKTLVEYFNRLILGSIDGVKIHGIRLSFGFEPMSIITPDMMREYPNLRVSFDETGNMIVVRMNERKTN